MNLYLGLISPHTIYYPKRGGVRSGLGIEMNPPTEPPAPSFSFSIIAFSFLRTYWMPELPSLSYSALLAVSSGGELPDIPSPKQPPPLLVLITSCGEIKPNNLVIKHIFPTPMGKR